MNLTGCQQGRMGVRDSWGIWNQHVHTAIFRMNNQPRSYCMAQGTLLNVIWHPWIGGESGGEQVHVYVWLSLFAVQLKLSQHC